jgi:hypothetical protein
MKKNLLLVLISFISISSYSQDTINKIIDECYFSINKTTMGYDNVDGKAGLGFGLNKVFLKDRKLSIATGVNVNWTNFTQTYYTTSKSFYYKNMDFKNSYLSIPLAGRLNFGDVIKYYFETGIYYDFGLSASKSGDYYSLVDPENNIYQKTKEIDETIDSHNYFGYSIAFGLVYKIGKGALIIRPETKFGDNKSAYFNYFGYHKLSIGVQF